MKIKNERFDISFKIEDKTIIAYVKTKRYHKEIVIKKDDILVFNIKN